MFDKKDILIKAIKQNLLTYSVFRPNFDREKQEEYDKMFIEKLETLVNELKKILTEEI